MPRCGRVVAVCHSLQHGLPKLSHPFGVVGPFGLDNDAHAREIRYSSRREVYEPNTRHILIVAQEALLAINDLLGLSLGPGDFGENLLVEGLGDLSDVPNGTTVRINDSVILRVSEQCQPCKSLVEYHRHPDLLKASLGRRGLLTTVVSGVGQVLKSGQVIELMIPAKNTAVGPKFPSQEATHG